MVVEGNSTIWEIFQLCTFLWYTDIYSVPIFQWHRNKLLQNFCSQCGDFEVFDVALFMLIIWWFFLLSDEFNAAGLTEYKCLVSDYKIYLYSVSNMQEIPDKSHISFCF